MDLQATTLESWIKIQPEIGRRQKQILDVLSIKPMSNREISKFTTLPINSITPRVHELRKKGLVKACGEVFDGQTKRNVIVWKVEEVV